MNAQTELKKSHDAMAQYLIYLCQVSDVSYQGRRTPATEKNYQQARQLIERAGFKYEPKKQL